jgi:hypothetical protein
MKNTLLAFAIVLFSNSSHLNAQCSDHLQLDGGSEYLHTPFENYTFNHLTMECWINHADYTSNVHYISLYKNIYAVIGNWSGTPNYTTWLDGVNPISITAPTSVPVNTWQHIAFVYDGATQFFYVNGILVASQASSGAINNSASFNSGLVIGARYDQSSQFMTGMINDIRIWNVARTQVEIQSAMNSTLSGSEPGLIAYYNFNSGFGGSTVYDLTANGNDLTLMNMDPATDWLEGNDNVAPVADLVSLPDVNADCEVTSLTVPTATDNCVGLINGVSDAILPITAQGTTVVTWTYDDGNGNTSTQTQVVVINDETEPIPNEATLADVIAECSVTTLTEPSATDNCGGVVLVTNNATLPITAQGTTVVTWTYDDGNGNTSTQTQNIVITCSASIDENVAQPFEVYPNPFHDKFQLTSDFDLTLSISDQYGKIVANIELKANEAREIDMELFSAGIYMIRSLNDGTSSAYRIVKY